MAVIIPNMDMPKGCWGCKCIRAKDPETNYCMLSGNEFDDRLDLLTTRQKDCPLRSADEMIAEIKKAKKFWGEYKRTSLTIEMEEIIHKYCDKE